MCTGILKKLRQFHECFLQLLDIFHFLNFELVHA